mmetsp:Transcript_30333/g.55423  ORF Transcript_30333/g.55423 Transcript_30333/m.55423 type:complete len:103 (-) Transcript_30333:241-549(-)
MVRCDRHTTSTGTTGMCSVVIPLPPAVPELGLLDPLLAGTNSDEDEDEVDEHLEDDVEEEVDPASKTAHVSFGVADTAAASRGLSRPSDSTACGGPSEVRRR